MSVPIAQITHALYRGTARGLTGSLTLEHDSYNREVRPMPYDPATVRSCSRTPGGGWAATVFSPRTENPFRLNLLLVGTGSQPFAEMVQASLKEMGIRLDISIMDGAAAVRLPRLPRHRAALLEIHEARALHRD